MPRTTAENSYILRITYIQAHYNRSNPETLRQDAYVHTKPMQAPNSHATATATYIRGQTNSFLIFLNRSAIRSIC
jgi:hypothetical protein